ncbi:MAG TPA: cation-translocating P-type ATPase [Candidatus Angelobacter sp.]|nr:cation-translocating P-type ATPase [Candidatus Angelobacter sp.]
MRTVPAGNGAPPTGPGRSTTGLTSAEAGRRLTRSGPNTIAQHGRISVRSSIGAQLRDPLILVLLAALVLTLVTGDWTDAAVIGLVVAVNTTVGVAQEVRADRAVTALAQLSAPTVRVRRDGTECSIAARDLVPGDVVLLGEGDVVPADCLVLEAVSLLVDESALTGESVAVGKSGAHGELPGEPLSSGTVVVKGRCVAEVTGTGAESALGRIAALLDTRVQPTPLQRRLAGLGRVLAVVAVVLSAVVLGLGVARGEPFELMLVTAISLAVAAVPESLPAVVTLSLGIGARRMAARNAIVRRLPAVETLGSVTVVATDKTGTLTEAQMVVEELWTPQHQVSVTGAGYRPDGEFVAGGTRLDLGAAPDVRLLLEAVVLCNDATLVPPAAPGSPWTGLGDPTELALLVVAAKAGVTRDLLEAGLPRVDEVPFDSAAQCMSTAHALPGTEPPRVLVVTKGSVEALHARARHGQHAAAWHEAVQRAAELADRGFRVLAVGVGEADRVGPWADAGERLLGLVAMDDPAKPAALATIRACQDAGITPVLITGDHSATARAVAVRVGILPPDAPDHTRAVATGPRIEAGEVADLTAVRVFARTSPAQKLDIVQAWKDEGAVVAMTGDGVNDGPALRRADIGVAMGLRGTEVARQAADLVLADDDLATVVAAVEEGRRVYANIRLFLVFGLSGGAAEILLMLLGPFTGLAVPLVAAQILWINLLTHGLTGVALGAEPAAPGLMRRPPRPPEQSVLGDGLWQRVLVISAVLGTVGLGLGVWAHDSGRPWQSIVFLALVSLQLGVALGLRPRLFSRSNLFLPLAVAGSLLLGVAGIYVPVLADLLGTVPLPAADLALALSTLLVGWLAARLTGRRRQRPRSTEMTSVSTP